MSIEYGLMLALHPTFWIGAGMAVAGKRKAHVLVQSVAIRLMLALVIWLVVVKRVLHGVIGISGESYDGSWSLLFVHICFSVATLVWMLVAELRGKRLLDNPSDFTSQRRSHRLAAMYGYLFYVGTTITVPGVFYP